MLFIRRMWILPALFITAVLYYLFLRPADEEPLYYPPNAPDGLVHWLKRPEKHPLNVYQPLPEGPAEPIPKIQHDFTKTPETAKAKQIREQRQAVVKEAFLHTWNGYRKHAWGKDEVAPISGLSRSSFGGWGATLVDAMDTLWIMGLEREFEQCVDFVGSIDFTTNTEDLLNIFETTIRYLGGILAAYDLSGGKHAVLLDKAVELADMLYSAFDTSNRMPVTRWNWQKSATSGALTPTDFTLLAEFGSLSLELTRLSQLTHDDKYFDAVHRIALTMSDAQNSTKLPGLWPTVVNPRDKKFDYNHFTLGGMADSTYEYLPKQHMLLSGLDPQYQKMYEFATTTAEQHLFFRPMLPNNADVLFSGSATRNLDISFSSTESVDTDIAHKPVNLDPQGQHLTCFAAGMLGMGSRIFNRPDDLPIAQKLLDGCVWAYNATPSGLMPETFHLVPCHIGTSPAPVGQCKWDEEKWLQAVVDRQGSTPDTASLAPLEQGKWLAKHRLILPGFTDYGDSRYILRPEAIESVFILYRITGDRKYQDVAWHMWEAINRACKTPIAYAAVKDVRFEKPQKSDRMESFWLAETIKYFYLMFAETSEIDLDEWVLNTEAHPFKRPV